MLIDHIFSQIKKRVLPYYFIVDETSFFSEHIISELKNAFLGKKTSENFCIHYSDQLNIENVLNDLKTRSLFSKRRLMVIKDARYLLKEHSAALLQFMKEGQKNQPVETSLVFTDAKKSSHDLFSYCKKEGAFFEFKKPYDSQMPSWVHWIVCRQKKNIQPAALSLLIEKVGTDLSRLQMEIEKIALYLGETRNEIEETDVRALLYSTRSHSIFELTSAIGHQKKNASLRICERMIEEGESEIFIFSMILRHLKNLWKAVQWKFKKSDSEIQSLVGIHPIFWNEFRNQRELFLNAPFENYWSQALETDKRLKTSNIDKRGVLFQFINSLC